MNCIFVLKDFGSRFPVLDLVPQVSQPASIQKRAKKIWQKTLVVVSSFLDVAQKNLFQGNIKISHCSFFKNRKLFSFTILKHRKFEIRHNTIM